MTRVWYIAISLGLLLGVGACAQAGSGDPSPADAAQPAPDAPIGSVADAPVGGPPDAAPGVPDATPGVPDAAPPPPDAPGSGGTPDALPPGSNLLCNSHADCTIAGECCFTFGSPPGFCVQGTEIGSLCLPN
jgi:hypothetical protein